MLAACGYDLGFFWQVKCCLVGAQAGNTLLAGKIVDGLNVSGCVLCRLMN